MERFVGGLIEHYAALPDVVRAGAGDSSANRGARLASTHQVYKLSCARPACACRSMIAWRRRASRSAKRSFRRSPMLVTGDREVEQLLLSLRLFLRDAGRIRRDERRRLLRKTGGGG